MSSLSSATLFSQDYHLLHFHSRRLFLHVPFHQSKSKANPLETTNHYDKLDPYSRKFTFDANVIIVLSLLVCALICSVIVNFIVRCALRCISSPSTQSENNSTQKTNPGVEKTVLKTFTILKYSEVLNLPRLGSECVICLSEFKPSERLRILPKCNHGFHVWCIDKWLGLHSSCPTCRNCLTELSQKIVNCSQVSIPAPASTPTPETRETRETRETVF